MHYYFLELVYLVQKFYSIKDDRAIKSGTVICTIFAIVIAGSAYFVGSLTRVFLSPQTYPALFADKAHFVDKLVPMLIKVAIPKGLNFLILLLVLSASMSTLAALVLVSASSIVKDLYHGFVNPKASDKTLNLFMRIMCTVFILTSVFITLLRPAVILTLLVISWGAIASVFLAPFIYGLFWQKANKIAAEISSVSGLALTLILFLILSKRQIPFIATLGMGVPMIIFPIIVWLTSTRSVET
jgi:Na+/proline symporter